MKILVQSPRRFSVAVLLPFFATMTLGCSGGKETPEVTFERGRLLGDRGQFEDAVPLYDLAIEALPDRAVFYYERGRAYEGLGLLDKAVEDYTTCLDKDPLFLQAQNNKGVVLAKMELYEKAATEFGKLIAEQPDDALALRNRGLCYHDMADYDRALVDYDKALTIAPNDVPTWFQRGNVFLEQKNFEEAILNYDKAIEFDTAFAKAWMNRGVARYGLNQREAAIKDLEQAQLLDNNIVLPGIDWLTAGTEDLSAARPTYLEAAAPPDWTEALNTAMSTLSDKGLENLTLDSAIPEQLCGRLNAKQDGKPVVAYFAVQQNDSSDITLPAITVTGDDETTLLLVLKPVAAGKDYDVAVFDKDWQPAEDDVVSSSVTVKLPVRESKK